MYSEKVSRKYLLTKEDMFNPQMVPNWVIKEFTTFDLKVSDKTFPCTFGMAGHKKGELRYGYISHDDWSDLPHIVTDFIKLFDESPDLIRHGLFLFVEPENDTKSLEYYRDYFWKVLQYLHDHDPVPWPQEYPEAPDNPLWNFCFGGEAFFIFGNTPAYKQRKTRDLGNCLILGFQPRKIFKGLEGTTSEGQRARSIIRKRVEKWDNLPKHPNISHYGDPGHREWKQYFIGDDITPIKGNCPFHP